MGIFDFLFEDAVKKEVDRQLADRVAIITERISKLDHRAAEALAGNAANAHNIGLLQGAITTLDRKVSGLREQMQSDEDFTRQLALRVTSIEDTDGGTTPGADGG